MGSNPPSVSLGLYSSKKRPGLRYGLFHRIWSNRIEPSHRVAWIFSDWCIFFTLKIMKLSMPKVLRFASNIFSVGYWVRRTYPYSFKFFCYLRNDLAAIKESNNLVAEYNFFTDHFDGKRLDALHICTALLTRIWSVFLLNCALRLTGSNSE